MGLTLGAIGTFFASGPGEAIAGGVASAGLGAGISALTAPKAPNINIPPPPGAAMIDPAGASAAAATRRRQAVSGGLDSTISGAGAAANAGGGGPTSGGKNLLGA